jgi:hypothetical protein
MDGFDWELRAVHEIVRSEASRLDPLPMAEVRMRAFAILADLEERAGTDLELLNRIDSVRRELG